MVTTDPVLAAAAAAVDPTATALPIQNRLPKRSPARKTKRKRKKPSNKEVH